MAAERPWGAGFQQKQRTDSVGRISYEEKLSAFCTGCLRMGEPSKIVVQELRGVV